MNRTELLHLARQCTFSLGYSAHLAEKLASISDVEREKATLERRATASRTRARWFCVLYTTSLLALIATGILAWIMPALRNGDTGAIALGALLMAFASGISTLNAADNRRAALDEHARITPMVRPDDRRQALEYVQAGHPAVLAWRDLAVAERGELYDFDLMVLRDLHFASIQAEQDAAVELAAADVRRQLYSQTSTPANN